MAISFPALLKLANFPPDKVDKLMKNIQYLNEGEKLKLANDAWYFITQKYLLSLSNEKAQILEEVKQGKRKYNANDIEEVKTKLVRELVHELSESELSESLEEVRKTLEKYSGSKNKS